MVSQQCLYYPRGENKTQDIILKTVFALPVALAQLPFEEVVRISNTFC